MNGPERLRQLGTICNSPEAKRCPDWRGPGMVISPCRGGRPARIRARHQQPPRAQVLVPGTGERFSNASRVDGFSMLRPFSGPRENALRLVSKSAASFGARQYRRPAKNLLDGRAFECRSDLGRFLTGTAGCVEIFTNLWLRGRLRRGIPECSP